MLLPFSARWCGVLRDSVQSEQDPTRQFLAEVRGRAIFLCLDNASDDAVEGGARFFKDGVAITIDGSKYTRPLTHGLNVNNVGLADEGEYTCRLEDTSCVSDTLKGYLLGEVGRRPGALSCGVDSLATITTVNTK